MSNNSSHLDDLTISFLAESREMLDEVEPYLVELGQSSSEMGVVDEETVNLVFRLFHSLKGSAGFFQFSSIVNLTHIAETLLDLFRSGQSQMGTRHTDILCRSCDVVSLLLDQVEQSGTDGGYEQEVDQISKELQEMIEQEKSRAMADEPDTAAVGAASDTSSQLIDLEDIKIPEDSQPPPSVDETPEFVLPMSDLIERFTQEADEQLELVEQVILESEMDPDNTDAIADAFRALHSFKGNCGMCGFPEMERLSHSAETVIEAVKDGRIKLEQTNAALLHVVDVLRNAVADVSRGNEVQIDRLGLLVDMLNDLVPMAEVETPPTRADIIQPEALQLIRDIPETDEAAAAPRSEETQQQVLKPRSVVRNDIRVDLKKLDLLINLVGELVIGEAMVTRNPDLEGLEFENFDRAATHLNKIVRDLQDVALSVRMIPVAGIFRKMIRLVHDLSAKANKKVDLRLIGEETEIDKTVAEHLADPLVHLVRNAIDHGLETTEERKANGKNPTGRLTIEARHEGGEVWIIIKDDGRGISREQILTKAINQGLVKGDGSDLSDADVFALIFEPGFSTATQVTDISGRGVGMDVVKKNIEKIKGRVDVQSRKGKGTNFILRIPLTLAIMEGMLVRVGKSKYTIPILSIRESLQITPDKVTVTMDGQEVVKVRDDLLPVVRLHDLHRIEADYLELTQGLLVILEHHENAFCLLVDEILGEEQTVIKGLSGYMGDIRGISGCTILGDGDISLILDVGGLFDLAHD